MKTFFAMFAMLLLLGSAQQVPIGLMVSHSGADDDLLGQRLLAAFRDRCEESPRYRLTGTSEDADFGIHFTSSPDDRLRESVLGYAVTIPVSRKGSLFTRSGREVILERPEIWIATGVVLVSSDRIVEVADALLAQIDAYISRFPR